MSEQHEPVPAPAPQPTNAQVISAAVQNVVVAICVSLGWYTGKVGTEIALVVLCLIVGVDFLGRKKLPGSSTLALAFGSTGVFRALSNFSHFGAIVFAALTALGLASCATTDTLMPKAAAYLEGGKRSQVAVEGVYVAFCKPAPLPDFEWKCLQADAALTWSHDALNSVIDIYTTLNDEVAE